MHMVDSARRTSFDGGTQTAREGDGTVGLSRAAKLRTQRYDCGAWPTPCIDDVMNAGLVGGAVAGMVGTWAMSEKQRLWTYAVDGHVPESAGGHHDARDWQERSEHQNSNERAAQAIARPVLGRRLTRRELRVAAPLMHSLFETSLLRAQGFHRVEP